MAEDEHDLNIREVADPFYLRRDNHVISGDGMYCPNEEVKYDPTPGLGRGDSCELCDEVVNI